MRKRKFAFALPLALVVALLLALGVSTGSAKTQKKAEALKAAWMYVGPHNDNGWSQAHDKGRLYVQKQLGAQVETTYKELVPEGPQTTQVIESLIRDGNKIIFATSFGFQPAMVAAAKKYPDVKFEMATGTAQSKNMAEYFGAGEDGIYLSGMAAGAATKKGVIGYVVPFPIPEIIRHEETGLVVPPGDREALVGAMRRLVESAELRCRFGAAARSRIRGVAFPPAYASKLGAIIGAVMSPPAASQSATQA
jgi:basic membrane lipoprotein Med (substrate-binding protein (PBP1-ABC) superfamily)